MCRFAWNWRCNSPYRISAICASVSTIVAVGDGVLENSTIVFPNVFKPMHPDAIDPSRTSNFLPSIVNDLTAPVMGTTCEPKMPPS